MVSAFTVKMGLISGKRPELRYSDGDPLRRDLVVVCRGQRQATVQVKALTRDSMRAALSKLESQQTAVDPCMLAGMELN